HHLWLPRGSIIRAPAACSLGSVVEPPEGAAVLHPTDSLHPDALQQPQAAAGRQGGGWVRIGGSARQKGGSEVQEGKEKRGHAPPRSEAVSHFRKCPQVRPVAAPFLH